MTVSIGNPMAGGDVVPPYLLRPDFLPSNVVAGLFDLVARKERAFVPSRVGRVGEGAIDVTTRISTILPDIGSFATTIGERVAPLAAGTAEQLGIAPFKLMRVQIEVAAHGDGAFYARHSDVQRPDPMTGTVRMLSGVYYFFARPKAFSGGELRLYGANETSFVDVEPVHNACVFFAPQTTHEVMPVSCPSGRFADSRFAVNLWFVGHALPQAAR
ncbi:MAG TPA: 2OG-Fe(II) oxygenase [Rhizomicrobium sp.]